MSTGRGLAAAAHRPAAAAAAAGIDFQDLRNREFRLTADWRDNSGADGRDNHLGVAVLLAVRRRVGRVVTVEGTAIRHVMILV